MFIRKDNTIIWSRVLFGALITAALVLCGVFFWDVILNPLIRNNTCWPAGDGRLCSLALFVGKIFGPKVWLGASLLSVLFFFVYKAIRNEFDFRYAFVKIKNSYVFYVFYSVFLAYIITGCLKILIGRSRPFVDAVPYFEPLNYTRYLQSMPSGHTAVSFAGLVMIGMLFPRVKWATWSLAILIAVSRIYVGVHWPSDVIFGAFIGMLCADLVKVWLRKINTK